MAGLDSRYASFWGKLLFAKRLLQERNSILVLRIPKVNFEVRHILLAIRVYCLLFQVALVTHPALLLHVTLGSPVFESE